MNSKIGIGPVSHEVIDAVIDYSNQHDVPLMLISSRNQIECAAFGGGYAGNFTTEQYAAYVRNKDVGKKVLLCRDHSGPYFFYGEDSLEPEQALQRALQSIKVDIDSGFDIIHVDCCKHKGDVYEAAAFLLKEAMAYANEKGRNIRFEVGTEDNVGLKGSDIEKFEKDLEFITDIVKPHFVVGQTGSLVKEIYQVGYFDYQVSKKLVEIAHRFDVRFKEHNADYLTSEELKMRDEIGVDAINIAPEYGVVQTKTVLQLSNRYGLFELQQQFLNKSLESNKWKKWVYGTPSEYIKSVIAGHYVFMSDEYGELVEKIGGYTDVKGEIHRNLMNLIDHYVKAFVKPEVMA